MPTQRQLVLAAVIAVPFYELLFKAMPFVKVIAPDSREPKQLIAMLFCVLLFSLAALQGTFKKLDNRFLLVIPVVFLISFFSAPAADLYINNINFGDMYFWKPFCQAICYLMLVLVVASLDDTKDILNVMCAAAFVMALYVILQKLGFDQFWTARAEAQWQGKFIDSNVGGNLGQKTVVASYIACMVPIAVMLRKRLRAFVMATACLLITSDMAILSLLFVLTGCYMIEHRQQVAIILFIAAIIVVSVIIALILSSAARDFIEHKASGRVEAWKQTISDIRHGAIEGTKHDFSILGVGLGRFPVIFPTKHDSRFKQAHSDPLELIYSCGIVAFVVVALAFAQLFHGITTRDQQYLFMLCALSTIVFCSFFSFVFQLASQQLYAAILIGLLHNKQMVRC